MVEIDKSVGRPDFRPKFLAGYKLSGTLQQCRQHLQGLALQTKFRAPFAQFARAGVQFKTSKRSTRRLG